MTINLPPRELRLKFDIATIIWSERELDTKLASIIDELQSVSGPSLRTLRALLTAGAPSPQERMSINMEAAFARSTSYLDQRNGSRLIEEHGVAACSAAVGKAMGEFIATIMKDAA